ncbi:hypothetical protein BC830DRAFT_1109227 [Chytriomyces sp. MP71]|nr:hypothetical protein BC830DRAFT_1109227 [Chytriomyces sp. MP71]
MQTTLTLVVELQARLAKMQDEINGLIPIASAVAAQVATRGNPMAPPTVDGDPRRNETTDAVDLNVDADSSVHGCQPPDIHSPILKHNFSPLLTGSSVLSYSGSFQRGRTRKSIDSDRIFREAQEKEKATTSIWRTMVSGLSAGAPAADDSALSHSLEAGTMSTQRRRSSLTNTEMANESWAEVMGSVQTITLPHRSSFMTPVNSSTDEVVWGKSLNHKTTAMISTTGEIAIGVSLNTSNTGDSSSNSSKYTQNTTVVIPAAQGHKATDSSILETLHDGNNVSKYNDMERANHQVNEARVPKLDSPCKLSSQLAHPQQQIKSAISRKSTVRYSQVISSPLKCSTTDSNMSFEVMKIETPAASISDPESESTDHTRTFTEKVYMSLPAPQTPSVTCEVTVKSLEDGIQATARKSFSSGWPFSPITQGHVRDFHSNSSSESGTTKRELRNERQKSVHRASVISSIIESATTPKFTVQGSIASLQNTATEFQSKFMTMKDVVCIGLNPLSAFSTKWELVISLLHLSIVWIVPLLVSFQVHVHYSYSLILTAVFAVDTLLEFVTFRASKVVMKANEIPSLRDWQRHYLKSGFLLDLVAAIPFELLPVELSNILWLLRLLRVRHLPGIMTHSPYYISLRKNVLSILGIGHTFSGIFSLTLCLCAFLHLQACAIFWAGRLNDYSNASIAAVQNESIGSQYSWALFTATGNTFPLFYRPTAVMEQLFVIAFVISGAALYAGIVGTISSIAIGFDASGRLYKQKMDELKDYMEWKDLSDITRRKVMKYYEVKYRGKYFEEATLLSEMNDSLRMEIAAHNCQQLISKVSFLQRNEGDGRDSIFIGRIATALVACYFVAGDVIMTAGDRGSDMYFVLSGTVSIIVDNERAGQIRDGGFFGELGLIANIPRTATVQAGSSCILYRLTRNDFMRILPEFPDVEKRIQVIYHDRMEKVRQEVLGRSHSQKCRER